VLSRRVPTHVSRQPGPQLIADVRRTDQQPQQEVLPNTRLQRSGRRVARRRAETSDRRAQEHEVTMKTCPTCSVELIPEKVATIQVDQCPECKGLWFEDQELRLAKDHADRDLVWMDFEIWNHPELFQVDPHHRMCPGCRSEMVAIGYDSTKVNVDYCTTCHGIWLDKGDFQRIIEQLAKQLTQKTATEYLKASLSEAKELFTGSESFLSEWRDLEAVLRLLQRRFFIEHPGLLATLMKMPR
jgi:Zn-finger nucleic acid-binding protein